MNEPLAVRRVRAGGILVGAFLAVTLLARAGLPVLAASLLHVPALLFAWRQVRRRGA